MEITSAQFVRSVVGSHNVIADKKAQYAFMGRSNVGKSSLINMLTGKKDLVRSSATPGKTQEVNFFLVNKNYYFVDLPGYGFAKLGMKRRDKLRKLIFWYLTSGEAPVTKVILIIDVKVGFTDFDHETLELLHTTRIPFIVAANKIDKLSQKKLHTALQKIYDVVPEDRVVPVSAQTGKGRATLLDEIFA